MSQRALITGITGQDGSYLAELLLDKGYEVHGMVRRLSSENHGRLEPIRDRITLHTGDLLDQSSLAAVLRASEPAEIYNLAAMSFVAASWNQPTLTAEFSGVGVTRMLEAMREVCPGARFYQASSSEMFGKVREVPQNESTPFYPRSPYGVAKAYGHFITVNYRESYGLFACSGILFNHECLSSSTPVVVRRNGVVEVVTGPDLVSLRDKGRSVQQFEPDGLLEIWDGEDWTIVTAITATRRRRTDPSHEMLSVEARGGSVVVTAHHNLLDAEESPIAAGEAEVGARLLLADEELFEPTGWTAVSPELGEFLGLMVADGYVSNGAGKAKFTNNDSNIRARVAELWSRLFLGRASEWVGTSGWNPENPVHALNLVGAPAVGPWLREQLYTRTGHKKVPPLVLNADVPAQRAFLDGYYAGDGLKTQNRQSVTTNSPVLAQGLCLLYGMDLQHPSVYLEQRAGRVYYALNIPSEITVGMYGSNKGQHLRKDPAEVRRIRPANDPGDWVFDFETESGKFAAGVGRLVVKNSPRRGLEFVSRKITHGAAAIKLGLADELRLGNLEARRDWGYAPDYVEAMWLMLQQPEPDDYVIGTGEDHSVNDLVGIAFDHVGLDPAGYIKEDPAFLRPAEVDQLIADPSKAREQLGWEPKTGFEEMVRLMVDADLELLRAGAPVAQA